MIHHKNKVTPYVNHTLKGVARKTILRGQVIHETTSCTNSNAFANKKSTGVFVYPKDKASVSKM